MKTRLVPYWQDTHPRYPNRPRLPRRRRGLIIRWVIPAYTSRKDR